MPRPATRRAIAHVGTVTGHGENINVNEPLPAPLTTRNLRPRYSASTSIRSRNSRKANPRLDTHTHTLPIPTTSTSHTHPSSSRSMIHSDEEEPIAGPSRSFGARYTRPRSTGGLELERERAAKRRRTGRVGTETPEWTSDGDEEVDQLISDNEDNIDANEDADAAAPESEPEPPPSQLEPSDPTLDDTTEREASAEPGTSSRDAIGTPVSSPSLAKILHTTNVEPQGRRSSSPVFVASTTISASKSTAPPTPNKPPIVKLSPPPAETELLSEYTCPICFFPPTNATLTPCGHICCGACLFTAVRTTMQRGAIMMAEGNGARCPVCRAEIPGWDGRGGGVIGLKPRAVFSL